MAAERTSQDLSGPELVAIECPVRLKAEQNGGDGQRERTGPGLSLYDGLIDRLGGPSQLSDQLAGRDPNRPVELTLIKCSTNDFVRPVPGEWVQTSNILIKVIKRTRKLKKHPARTNETSPTPIGDAIQPITRLYKIEPVGVIPTTVRFRALADYQYTPELKHPINVLARDMRSLNFEGILKFGFEAETEDYSSSKIGLFPPPLFSRYLVPQLYHYRQNIPTVVTQTSDGSQRLINRTRYVPMGPQTITYDQPDVPQSALARDLEQKKPENQALFQKLASLFEQRPIWSRMAFQHHLTPIDLRYIRQNKVILAHYCYLFSDGPFRELLIRFGYDPRLIPEARFYQRMSLRNVDRKEAKDKLTLKLMKKPITRSDTAENATSDALRDHIFDGLELHQSVGTYQLCDITDPLLVSLINSTKGVLPKCDVRTGWFTSNAIEQIRSILRRKFHALLDEQRVVKDIECVDLLDIDISQDAVDLLKKSGSAHSKKSKESRQQNKDSQVDPESVDPDPESTDAQSPSSRRRKPANSKPRHPNPLLKLRRERQRVRAKAVGKRVAFTEPSGRGGRNPDPSGSRGPKARAGASTSNRMEIDDQPTEEKRSEGEGGPEGDDEEGQAAEEEDFFKEDIDDDDDDEEEEEESSEEGEDQDDEDEDPFQQDRSSSLSDLSS
ncbi:tau 95 subunit of transcription factor TFIIIC [Puccinia graminis f. sp. tritici]|uniref:Tau 95 subunit of transcription factor TFIIIC n=1 Tax=Puccinia graminis f. sp. tritici TaxID=56615 RepID=A0A5B0LSF3_PUCGR|nr:tau 95 subunit of transcription factor TFIIIC [Puccinia graminis f. sp. tritici]KAA1091724.1 tau 95 subunit of transcription factor TFIIIC [Puccinia graminis f. sp. tritici]